jgi:hypothetical protein
VRVRYDFACGYCGVSEATSGGELTVDHYYPESRGGGENDENLVYACFRCNLYKSDRLPFMVSGDAAHRVVYVLHPLIDDIAAHITEDVATGTLQALTETGASHIAVLRLNRAALIEHRLRRHADGDARRHRAALEAVVAEQRTALDRMTEYADVLERLLERFLQRD